jgi:transcriptional regulator with XRE-family HTH domain
MFRGLLSTLLLLSRLLARHVWFCREHDGRSYFHCQYQLPNACRTLQIGDTALTSTGWRMSIKVTTNDQRDAFRQALRHARQERGWSQRRLAQQVGVSHSAISSWERGSSLPEPANVVDLERALSLESGMLARMLGYMPLETMRRELRTVLDAIMADPDLGQRERDLLLAMYRELVRQRRAERKTGQAETRQVGRDDR